MTNDKATGRTTVILSATKKPSPRSPGFAKLDHPLAGRLDAQTTSCFWSSAHALIWNVDDDVLLFD